MAIDDTTTTKPGGTTGQPTRRRSRAGGPALGEMLDEASSITTTTTLDGPLLEETIHDKRHPHESEIMCLFWEWHALMNFINGNNHDEVNIFDIDAYLDPYLKHRDELEERAAILQPNNAREMAAIITMMTQYGEDWLTNSPTGQRTLAHMMSLLDIQRLGA